MNDAALTAISQPVGSLASLEEIEVNGLLEAREVGLSAFYPSLARLSKLQVFAFQVQDPAVMTRQR